MELTPTSLIKNKKGQIGKKVNTVIIVIITIVILFKIFSALVPEVQSAGTEMGDATRCSDAGGFFNTTQTACLNGTNPEDTETVAFDAIPISSIFSSSGIVILLLMVTLLILIVRMVLPKRK